MHESHKNEASQYLLALAQRNAEVYAALPGIRAILLLGSTAEKMSDFYSDLDMSIYYDTLPSEEALLAASQANHGEERKFLGERSQDECLEIYQVQGIECQIIHTTLAAWERDMASIMEGLDVTSPLQKALSGTLEGIPLYGEDLVAQWKQKIADYPDTLARAMVEHYVAAITPIWGLYERMENRDGTIWLTQLLVEDAFAVLGILAGLNRLYYAPFQFKRMRRFVAQMNIAPDHLAERLEALFHTDIAIAAVQLVKLLQELGDLVETQMPDVDISALRRRLAWRHQGWRLQ